MFDKIDHSLQDLRTWYYLLLQAPFALPSLPTLHRFPTSPPWVFSPVALLSLSPSGGLSAIFL